MLEANDPDPVSAIKFLHPSQRSGQRRWLRRMNNYFVYRAFRRAIKDCRPAMPILMAPCGYGWFFDRFRRDGITVVGVDIDPNAIRFAKAAADPPMPVFQSNCLSLPFADGQFDLVLTNRFLLHFNDEFRAMALRELARVVRRFLLVHYDTASSLRQFLRNIRGAEKPHRDMSAMKTWRSTSAGIGSCSWTAEGWPTKGPWLGLKSATCITLPAVIGSRVLSVRKDLTARHRRMALHRYSEHKPRQQLRVGSVGRAPLRMQLFDRLARKLALSNKRRKALPDKKVMMPACGEAVSA